MAQTGLIPDHQLQQAAVLLLTAQAVQKCASSQRRAGAGSSQASIVKLCDEVISMQYAFLQYLHLEREYPSDFGSYALFLTASTIRHLLYEIEHEMLNLPAVSRYAREIEHLYLLRTTWSTDPGADLKKGILDDWNLEDGILLITRIRDLFSE